MEHVDYPHTPGYLFDCPACEACCHCMPGQAECVYDGAHVELSLYTSDLIDWFAAGSPPESEPILSDYQESAD